jgi:L-cysteine S-thiosulfotransferase
MKIYAILALAIFASTASFAQVDAEKEIERYRAMISDPMSNPGYLAVDKGESLWALKRGTKGVSLAETCDLGLGVGKLEGANAALPRYFKDTDKVMELEQRIAYCMETGQGLDISKQKAKPFSPNGQASNETEFESLVAFAANKSNGMKLATPQTHAKEKESFALGEAIFNRRQGPQDFACATCHDSPGARIRLQKLPTFSEKKEAQETMGAWPTYRVSHATLRTMQHRIWDCYWQMRLPQIEHGSEAVTALTTYLSVKAAGAEINVPSIKR